jgi:methylphosphotriester-DNA--protein-cysteine methyltransferase
MRGKVFFLLALFTLALLLPQAAEAKFYGSAKTKRYHHAYCRAAQKISARDLRVFDSGVLAKRRGYEPCKVCKPRDRP